MHHHSHPCSLWQFCGNKSLSCAARVEREGGTRQRRSFGHPVASIQDPCPKDIFYVDSRRIILIAANSLFKKGKVSKNIFYEMEEEMSISKQTPYYNERIRSRILFVPFVEALKVFVVAFYDIDPAGRQRLNYCQKPSKIGPQSILKIAVNSKIPALFL